MTDRDRLIELVDKAKREYAGDVTDHTETDYIVETLLNEGVIVPPCNVGDIVYYFCETFGVTLPYHIEQIIIDYDTENPQGYITFIAMCSKEDELLDDIDFTIDEIGKTVFLTKEEAEAEVEGVEKQCLI